MGAVMATGKSNRSVTGLLDDIAAQICNSYCKWPDQYKDENGEETDALYDEKCSDCPLKLI